jgi:hypothetical protein
LALALIVFALFIAYLIVRWLWRALKKLIRKIRPPKPLPISPGPVPLALEPKTIFVSYRRQDSADVTGRLTDTLADKFGRDSLFKDVDSIEIGKNFRKEIGQAMDQCRVLLVTIGNFWAGGGLHASEKTRLDDPSDLVRIEIEVALAKAITIIPVLVMGASMPDRRTLPESLQELADLNAVSIRADPDFRGDVERLIQGIGRYLSKSGRSRSAGR